MKREEAADVVGVMEKRFDAHAAPSGELPVTGGMRDAMTLFNGRARPKRPLNVEERGSFVTDVAAAVFLGVVGWIDWKCGEDKRTRTKRLTVNGIPANGNCIPDDGTLHGALDVVDLKIQACGGG